MRYNKYTNLIFEEVKDETDVNLKIRKLYNIRDQIDKTNHDIIGLINKLTKNLLKCPSCNKYFEPKNITTNTDTEIVKGVCVFRDCGYGDDDEYADVTYQVLYKKCPFCNKKVETDRYSIGETNRSDRWGNRR